MSYFIVRENPQGDWAGTAVGGIKSIEQAKASATAPKAGGNPTPGSSYVVDEALYDAYMEAKRSSPDPKKSGEAMLAFAKEHAASVVKVAEPYASTSLSTTPQNQNAPSYAVGVSADGQLFVGGPQSPGASMALIERQSKPKGREGDYFVVLEKDMAAVEAARSQTLPGGKFDLDAIRKACSSVAIGTAQAHPGKISVSDAPNAPTLDDISSLPPKSRPEALAQREAQKHAVDAAPQRDPFAVLRQSEPAKREAPQRDPFAVLRQSEPAKREAPQRDPFAVLLQSEPAKREAPQRDPFAVLRQSEPAKREAPQRDPFAVLRQSEPAKREAPQRDPFAVLRQSEPPKPDAAPQRNPFAVLRQSEPPKPGPGPQRDPFAVLRQSEPPKPGYGPQRDPFASLRDGADPAQRTIEINKGDTLSGLAKQLGLGAGGAQLLAQSISGCTDANKIVVGQQIDMSKLERLREVRAEADAHHVPKSSKLG